MIDRLLTWVILPALVFILSFQGGMYIKHHADHADSGSGGGMPCVHRQVGRVRTAVATSSAASAPGGAPAWESVLSRPLPVLPRHELIETDPLAFHKHRFEYMGKISTESVVLLQKEGESQDACNKYANPLSWLRKTGDGTKTNCLAVVKTSVPASPPIIRYKPIMPNLADPGADGHGFFTKVRH